MPSKERPCPKCGEKRTIMFAKDRTRRDGYQVLCRECQSQAMSQVRARPDFKVRRRLYWRSWYRRHHTLFDGPEAA